MAIDIPRRRRQDVGNVVALEHVNVRAPRQDLATAFYAVGLGLTRTVSMANSDLRRDGQRHQSAAVLLPAIVE